MYSNKRNAIIWFEHEHLGLDVLDWMLIIATVLVVVSKLALPDL
jgi:hypothetical protein